MTLLYEPLGLNRPDIVVFGAGHVGQAVLHLLATLPVTTSVIDSRLDWLESASAQHKLELVEDDLTPSLHQQALMRLVPANAWVLVMTHDHVTDYALIKGLIERTDLNFLGLIGSKTKWKNFSRRLLRDGLSESSLQRVQCPIGAGASRFKQPMAIAVDIVAELLRHLSLPTAKASGSVDTQAEESVSGRETAVLATHEPLQLATQVKPGGGMQPVTKQLLRDKTPGLFR